MIRLGNVLIVNGDETPNFENLETDRLCLLTCGLSLRATITASSIQEEGFTYCLQRSIFTLDGQELSPQEFNVSWSKKHEDLFPYLAMVTLLLLCGVPTKIFSSLQF